MVGVGLTKGLSEKLLSSSLSSIHILYNQALVGGLSVSYVPATRIDNIQLPGEYVCSYSTVFGPSRLCVEGAMQRLLRLYFPGSAAPMAILGLASMMG